MQREKPPKQQASVLTVDGFNIPPKEAKKDRFSVNVI